MLTSVYNKLTLRLSAVATVGLMGALSTNTAAASGGSVANTGTDGVSAIAQNITEGVADWPTFIAYGCYLAGAGTGIAGILKLKAHIDSPQQTEIKEGLVRLAASGALIAIPLVLATLGDTITAGDGQAAGISRLNTLQSLN